MPRSKEHEHFIPIRKADLVELLCGTPGLEGQERDHFRQLCRLLESTFHFEYHRTLEELKNTYAPFDPDADTRHLASLATDEKRRRLDELFAHFAALLERANFKRLSRDDLRKSLEGASYWGLNLNLDFEIFDHLAVFVRGDTLVTRTRRRLRKLFRLESVTLPIYRRLVIILRLRPHKLLGRLLDTNSVYIKFFKDIPQMDLEMLLPGTRVRMTLFDRGKIGVPLLTGLALTAGKVVQGVLTIALIGAMNIFALLGLAGGTIGYGVRSFLGYVKTRQKYQLALTQNLYFLNLDNNAGALFRLLDEAEEQEFREALLAYFFLWRQPCDSGWSVRELDRHVEHYLEQAAQVHVDFEIGDALGKLKRLRLVEELANGRLRAVPVARALAALDSAWDDYFRFSPAATLRSNPPARVVI